MLNHKGLSPCLDIATNMLHILLMRTETMSECTTQNFNSCCIVNNAS